MIYKKLLELGCNNEEVVIVMNNIILNLIQYNIEFDCIEDFFADFSITFGLDELEEIYLNFEDLAHVLQEELDTFCEDNGLCKCCGCNEFRESIINDSVFCTNCGKAFQ